MTRPIDTKNTDEIICPYCGYEFSESYEFGIKYNSEKIKCDECNKEFNAESEYHVTYTTTKLNCEDLKKEHKYEEKPSFSYIRDSEYQHIEHDFKDVLLPKEKWKYIERFDCTECEEWYSREITEEEFKEKYPDRYDSIIKYHEK